MKTERVHCKYDDLIEAAELNPHPLNPNEHNESQITLLSKILSETGWRNPVVISKDSGLIVSGHGRVMAALQMDDKRVPVNYQAFDSEEDELAHLLADNRLAELSDFNSKGVVEILKQLEAEGTDLDLTGFMDYDAQKLIEDALKSDDLVDLDEEGTKSAEPIKLTIEQRETFDQCARKIRQSEGEELSDGRIVEFIAADFLAG